MSKKIDNLWLKLLIVVLVVCGLLIIAGYLYYKNSSCGGNILDCFEFEVIILGGGILIFSLPVIIVLFFLEAYKKVEEKKDGQSSFSVEENLSELNSEFQKSEKEKGPESELSKSVLKYTKGEKEDNN